MINIVNNIGVLKQRIAAAERIAHDRYVANRKLHRRLVTTEEKLMDAEKFILEAARADFHGAIKEDWWARVLEHMRQLEGGGGWRVTMN